MNRLFIFLCLATVACTNNANRTAGTDSTRLREMAVDSAVVENDIAELDEADLYIWQVDNEQKTLRSNPKLAGALLSADSVLLGLNQLYPQIKLQKLKHSGDTLYTTIKDAAYLTEQMGSAGSEAYLAQAVINLTSAPGVNYVRIDFEPGSHAAPDVWSRENFKGFKVIQ